MFKLCDYDNITNSFAAHDQQKQIAVTIRKITHSVNELSAILPECGTCFTMKPKPMGAMKYLPSLFPKASLYQECTMTHASHSIPRLECFIFLQISAETSPGGKSRSHH